jgi:hypothetical protein
MSNTWPPQQEPPQSGWPQSWYPPQPPPYDEPGYGYGAGYGTGYGAGYGTGYGAGYGAPGPSSAGRPGGWPPPQGDPWSQWGGEPAQEMYQPGRPPPNLLPNPQAPYGTPDPYGTQDPYWAQGPYGPYGNHPTHRPRSFNWFVPVVVLMVFAILVAAGGAYALARYGPATTNPPATAQGTASRTPNIPAGFHSYTNATIGVQFDVPDVWTIDDNIAESGGTGMQATSPDATALLAAVSFPGDDSPSLKGRGFYGLAPTLCRPTATTLASLNTAEVACAATA